MELLDERETIAIHFSFTGFFFFFVLPQVNEWMEIPYDGALAN